MKIIKLEASNVKRLVAVSVTPSGAVVKVEGGKDGGGASVMRKDGDKTTTVNGDVKIADGGNGSAVGPRGLRQDVVGALLDRFAVLNGERDGGVAGVGGIAVGVKYGHQRDPV